MLIFKCIISLYMCVCGVCGASRQLVGSAKKNSFHSGAQKLNSVLQARQQAPLFTETSHQRC